MKKMIRRRVERLNQRLKTGWYLLLFPALALGVTGWMFYDYYRNLGPRLQIVFEDAAGLEPQKTPVKYRGVVIGMVQKVYISDDSKTVVAEVLLHKDVDEFAVVGTKFSLVTPKVNFQGISGLDTLFQGAYIAALPGNPDGSPQTRFQAQSMSAVDPLDDTVPFFVETRNAESVSQGDAVTYRGIKLGSVTKVDFDKPAREVLIRLNIQSKYARLIRTNTQFWHKAGIQAELGLFHSEIKVNSLDTVMNGGVELATPEPAGPRARALHKFALLENAPKDFNNWSPDLNGPGVEVKENPKDSPPPRMSRLPLKSDFASR